MERGLLWLPLLGVFFWLAWAGWNEYQKVEAYQVWAKDFQKAKYDLYSVLGLNGSDVTWGKPTRKGPIDLQTFSLQKVREIRLLAGGQVVDPQALPAKIDKLEIEFSFIEEHFSVKIPFSDIALATQWYEYLQAQQSR